MKVPNSFSDVSFSSRNSSGLDVLRYPRDSVDLLKTAYLTIHSQLPVKTLLVVPSGPKLETLKVMKIATRKKVAILSFSVPTDVFT